MKAPPIIFISLFICLSCKKKAISSQEMKETISQTGTTYIREKEQATVLLLSATQITDSIQRYMEIHAVPEGMSDPTSFTHYILNWEVNKQEDTVTVWLSQTTEPILQIFRKEVIDSPNIHFRKSSPLFPSEHLWKGNDEWCNNCGLQLLLTDTILTLPLLEKLSFTIYNHTDRTGRAGVQTTWIEYNDNGEWKYIYFKTNYQIGFSFPESHRELLPHAKETFEIPLNPGLYHYRPGSYRIHSLIHMESEHQEGSRRMWIRLHLTTPFLIKQ